VEISISKKRKKEKRTQAGGGIYDVTPVKKKEGREPNLESTRSPR
jgi:hypothetical protein